MKTSISVKVFLWPQTTLQHSASICILKTGEKQMWNAEKGEKRFHGNGHLCTTTYSTLIIPRDAVAKKPN